MFKKDYDDWLSTPPEERDGEELIRLYPERFVRIGSEWRYIGDDEEC